MRQSCVHPTHLIWKTFLHGSYKYSLVSSKTCWKRLECNCHDWYLIVFTAQSSSLPLSYTFILFPHKFPQLPPHSISSPSTIPFDTDPPNLAPLPVLGLRSPCLTASHARWASTVWGNDLTLWCDWISCHVGRTSNCSGLQDFFLCKVHMFHQPHHCPWQVHAGTTNSNRNAAVLLSPFCLTTLIHWLAEQPLTADATAPQWSFHQVPWFFTTK